MEPEVEVTAASAFHDSDFTPVGSPEADVHLSPSDEDLEQDHELIHDHQQEHEHDKDHDHDQSVASTIPTEDLKPKIIKQVEYYFSDENLPHDKYMMNLIKKNKEGFVPVAIIASFRKMKRLTRDYSFIVSALRESSLLVVSSDGKKVKRLHPFHMAEDVKDLKFFTVVVENLPDDHSLENLRKIFGEAGKIRNISVHDPHTAEEPKKGSKTEILISNRLHALVEYETLEAAEAAVATLNNEQDWRNGMRVKLLKQMVKYGQRRRTWKEPESEKNSGRVTNQTGGEESHNLNEHLDDTPDEEGADNLSKENNGQRARNRGRSRKNKYRTTNGLGHGSTCSVHAVEPSKPPPGPKMPDGTKGFTMGRGRPPVPK